MARHRPVLAGHHRHRPCSLSAPCPPSGRSFFWLYTWLLAQIVEFTGFEIWFSRVIALGLIAVLWYFAWDLLLLPWSGSRRKRAAILAGVTALGLALMALATQNVYFSRADGHPIKYYIRTLDGYELSTSPGTDPVYGIQYQPITAEVAREYLLWKRRGGNLQDSSIAEDEYFSASSGDPLRWYVSLPDGRVEFFPLPGFHPKYGTKLLPVTPEVVLKYEKDRAAQEVRQAGQSVNHGLDIQPGRYVFSEPYPTGAVGVYRFSLSEIELTAHRRVLLPPATWVESMALHLDIECPGGLWVILHDLNRIEKRLFSFGLILTDGRVIQPVACRVRAGEGAGAHRPINSTILFPAFGGSWHLVLEFPALEDRRVSFSPTINDSAVFGSINLDQAEFRSF